MWEHVVAVGRRIPLVRHLWRQEKRTGIAVVYTGSFEGHRATGREEHWQRERERCTGVNEDLNGSSSSRKISNQIRSEKSKESRSGHKENQGRKARDSH